VGCSFAVLCGFVIWFCLLVSFVGFRLVSLFSESSNSVVFICLFMLAYFIVFVCVFVLCRFDSGYLRVLVASITFGISLGVCVFSVVCVLFRFMLGIVCCLLFVTGVARDWCCSLILLV